MITVFGLDEAIVKFAEMEGKARVASSVTTTSGAGVVMMALKAAAPKRTGALAQSITILDAQEEATSSTKTVGARVPYDRFYQEGTSRQPARPYSEDVANAVDTEIGRIANEVFKAAL